LAVLLALAAALLFALGTVLQQTAGLKEPEVARGSGSVLLLRIARRPVWLAADALGFVAQAVALTIGRLVVVQPVLVFSVVFALPLGALLTGQRVRRADVAAAVVATTALAAFLLVADPSGGRHDAPVGEWIVAGAAFGGVSAALVLAARRRASPAPRAALLGIATALLFGLSAALTKAVGYVPVTWSVMGYDWRRLGDRRAHRAPLRPRARRRPDPAPGRLAGLRPVALPAGDARCARAPHRARGAFLDGPGPRAVVRRLPPRAAEFGTLPVAGVTTIPVTARSCGW
jgi:hypothetical protein